MKNLITLSKAANMCPIKTTRQSVWRWCRKGLVSKSGERVYLEHYRLGREILTTEENLIQFMENTADADKPYFEPKHGRRFKASNKPLSSSALKKRQEQAKKELIANGFLKDPEKDK